MSTTTQTMNKNIFNEMTTDTVVDSWEEHLSEDDYDNEIIDATAVMAQLYGEQGQEEEEDEEEDEDEEEEEDEEEDEEEEEEEDEEEFPSLGQEPKIEPRVRYAYDPVKGKTQNKKKLLVETSFCNPSTEYLPQEIQSDERNQLRTQAFNALADKDSENTQERLYKTKMCRSVTTDEPCPHGKNCRFAHNSEELRTAPCLFGENCKWLLLQLQ
jgi:hypothetical protein